MRLSNSSIATATLDTLRAARTSHSVAREVAYPPLPAATDDPKTARSEREVIRAALPVIDYFATVRSVRRSLPELRHVNPGVWILLIIAAVIVGLVLVLAVG